MHVSLVFISCPQTLTYFDTISTLQPPVHTNRWFCSTLLCVVSLDFLIVGIGGHLLVPLMVLLVPVVTWINCSKRLKTSKKLVKTWIQTKNVSSATMKNLSFLIRRFFCEWHIRCKIISSIWLVCATISQWIQHIVDFSI